MTRYIPKNYHDPGIPLYLDMVVYMEDPHCLYRTLTYYLASEVDAALADARRAVWEEAAQSVESTVCTNGCFHDVCHARRYEAHKIRAQARKETK